MPACAGWQLYQYFGSKDRLFDAVFEHHVAWLVDEVPTDASDLTAYAVALYDICLKRPALFMLTAIALSWSPASLQVTASAREPRTAHERRRGALAAAVRHAFHDSSAVRSRIRHR